MPETDYSPQSWPQSATLGGHERLQTGRNESRRGFLRGSSLLLAGALPAAGVASNSGGGEKHSERQPLKVGLIGCGYRGIVATSELLFAASSAFPLQLTAMADAFPDRLQQAFRTLRGRFGDRIAATATSRYVGLRAFEELLATDVDVVLLATPPVFRPQHFEAAVAAGKHVYAETPIATDIPGTDRFQAAVVDGQSRRLAVALGLWRYQPPYQAAIELIRQGAIGRIINVQALHQNVPRKTVAGSSSADNDVQLQLRQWPDYSWASGGSMFEQRARGLDLVNWLLDSHPLEACRLSCNPAAQSPAVQSPASGALATGGSVAPEGEVLEFWYPDGVKLRSATAAGNRAGGKGVLISVYGSDGWCDLTAGKIFDAHNNLQWQAEQAVSGPRSLRSSAFGGLSEPGESTPVRPSGGPDSGLWVQFLRDIAAGPQASSSATTGQAAVNCTRAAILGRMAADAQNRVRWDECLGSQEVFAGIALSRATLALTPVG